MSVRLVDAPLSIEFSPIEEESKGLFRREYDSMSESDDDPIGQWLRLAKAKGDTQESDQVLLTLMVELHRKIDALSAKLSNDVFEVLDLEHFEQIRAIGYEHFELKKECLQSGKHYYGRVRIPVFPKRDVSVFFVARSTVLAQVELMHDRDVKDWSAYLTARERALIRESKGL